MLKITEKAKEMLDQFAEQSENEGDLALKVDIIGRGPKGFQYDLQLVDNHLRRRFGGSRAAEESADPSG